MFVTSTSILVLLGITLCVEMILSIKRKENNGGTQIPFGPWLCTSGLVLLLALPVFLALG
jgi:prepilin signal peptidase PulO-like enzyme (type II secretory pathway)